MSTIPVTNLTDTPLAGETDLRQAITQAHSGDTTVLASGDFGELIRLKSPLIVSAGANLTIDFGAGEDNGIDGSIVIEVGATATMANMAITDNDVGSDSPDRPANWRARPRGVTVESGDPGDPGQGGNFGLNGFGGADGQSSTQPGENALGAIENFGDLKLVSDIIVGFSVAGNGVRGGDGGDGASVGGAPAFGGNGGDRARPVQAALAATAQTAATQSAEFSMQRVPTSRSRM